MDHRFTNALAEESSPYLLQHAHNPVNWYPWGQAALDKARQEDKPILVSIGYAACHWCHVMERESFENESVAEYMNAHFINIKIDREERPDLDQIYMDAVQAISGSGGWPLNVFLTPEGKPFYGGTYFPPKRAYNRPSWMELLQFMQDAWLTRRSELEDQASKLIAHIHDANQFYAGLHQETAAETDVFITAQCKAIREAIMAQADKEEGGFGKAPKFPQTCSIQYLLAHAYAFSDADARQHALLSLDKMLHGGIYDQLAGGLSRYSTDVHWLVPHFEKMLYDNALLLISLADAYQLTGDPLYRNRLDHIMQFLLTEMKDPAGGFYAALDADSEGVEGKFYVWDEPAFRECLGADADIMAAYFGVTEEGNWEGHTILTVPENDEVFAEKHGLPPDALQSMIRSAQKRLLDARSLRIRPQTDDKIILGWNALLLTAMCKCYAATGHAGYKEEAESLYAFITEKFSESGVVSFHTYKNGVAKYPAFLDDYAYLIQGCIALQEISSDQQYLRDAEKLASHVLAHFYDPVTGMFFYTPDGQSDLVARKIDVYDNATPSGNSIMAANLQYLSIVFNRSEWMDITRKMISGVLPLLLKYPTSFAVWARLVLLQVTGIQEILVLGNQYQPMLKRVLREFIPNKVLQSSDVDCEMPLFMGKKAGDGVKVYVCRDYQCLAPVSDWDGVKPLIKITGI